MQAFVARASGGMADAHGSGPCVRKDVRVQLPPRPPQRPRNPVQVLYRVFSCPKGRGRAGPGRLTSAVHDVVPDGPGRAVMIVTATETVVRGTSAAGAWCSGGQRAFVPCPRLIRVAVLASATRVNASGAGRALGRPLVTAMAPFGSGAASGRC